MENTKRILKQVKKLEISTRHLVDGLITGNYHSVFKGQGIEFSEIREYSFGDDVRSIDWKVTARFNRPFVKEFIEERDLHVYFVVDVSASGGFGSNISKQQKAAELTASLMFAAMRNNDNVGLFLFTDSIECIIPAKKGKRHVLKLIFAMVSHKKLSAKTNLKIVLEKIAKIIKKRSVIFIVSDFITGDFSQPLRILKRKHDIIAIRILDGNEVKLPEIGLIELEDEETGEQLLVDTSDHSFVKKYQELFENQERHLKAKLRKSKVSLIDVLSQKPYEVPLKRFFRRRNMRVR